VVGLAQPHLLIYLHRLPMNMFCVCADNDRSFERESKEWKRREWEAPGDALLINARDDTGLDSELEDEEETTWEVFSSAEEKARASNERARRAEVAAGLAAAQVMTILQLLH
jgi:hypothetical protein